MLRSSPFEGKSVPCHDADGQRVNVPTFPLEILKVTRGTRCTSRPPHGGAEFSEGLTPRRTDPSAVSLPRRTSGRSNLKTRVFAPSAGKTNSKTFAPTWPLVQARST